MANIASSEEKGEVLSFLLFVWANMTHQAS